MLSLLFSHQRKHINDLVKITEPLNITLKDVFNKYMDILLSKPIGYNPKEELDFAYNETMEFYRK